jgi:hypothetical protein
MYSISSHELIKLHQQRIEEEIQRDRLIRLAQDNTRRSLPPQRLVAALGSLTLATFLIMQFV